MAKCVIFCAAGFDGLVAPLAQDDYIIAADGGVAHAKDDTLAKSTKILGVIFMAVALACVLCILFVK